MTTITSAQDSLDQRIKALEAEHSSELAKLKAEKAKIEAKLKEIKAEAEAAKAEIKDAEAKAKASRLAEIMANGGIAKKVNKSEVLLGLMLQGKTRAQMEEETGYGKKFIIDVIWRLEKQYGLR